MAEWNNFVQFNIAPEILDDLQNVEGPKFLKFFPFPDNLPGKQTQPTFDFYNYKSAGELMKAITSGTNVEPESLTSKLKYLIALSKMGITIASDQNRIVSLYETGLKKNNWIPFYEYYFSVKNEIDIQEKLFVSLQQLFERRSSLSQSEFQEEKERTFNPIWDEVRHKMKANADLGKMIDDIKKSILSPDANPPPQVSEIRTAISLCETSDNNELINQYLSWPYIDFNEVPAGSLTSWSNYTSFRLENLLEKSDQSKRLLKTIDGETSADTELIRSLFIRPLGSLYQSANIDECSVDSPIERFNALASRSGIQWYGEIVDNKPKGIRLTHFSNLKNYLHYCMVRMGKGDQSGLYGWIQVLYFLGSDVIESLRDLTQQVIDKLEVYLEDHEGEKQTVEPILDYLDALDARFDDFFDFWKNRIRTQYGLKPPVGLENDPKWAYGFCEFSTVEMRGGRKKPRKDKNMLNNRRDINNANKKKKLVMGIPNYVICHQTEGDKLWPLESLPESILSSVKDMKSSFAGLTSMPIVSVYRNVGQQTTRVSPQQGVSGSTVEVNQQNSLKKQINKIMQEINQFLGNKKVITDMKRIDQAIITATNNATFEILFKSLTSTLRYMLYNLGYESDKIIDGLQYAYKDLQQEFNKAVATTGYDKIDSTILDQVKEAIKDAVGESEKTYINIKNLAGGDPTKKKDRRGRRGEQGSKRGDDNIDLRTTEGKSLRKLEAEEKFERKMAERKEYAFTMVTQEVSNKIDSLYWLYEFKTSAKYDSSKFDSISFKWWSGSTRSLENKPIYLGGAGVRVEGEASYDCAVPFVQLACVYVFQQKQKIMALLEQIKLVTYLTFNLVNLPDDALKGEILRSYQFLTAAFKEYAASVQRQLNKKTEMTQRNEILYRANLSSAMMSQWLCVYNISQFESRTSNQNMITRLAKFVSDTQGQFDSTVKSMSKLLKVGYQSFVNDISSQITAAMNIEIGQSPNMAVSGPAVSGVSAPGAPAFKSKYDFKVISPQSTTIITDGAYWDKLSKSLGNKNIWFPYTRDKGESPSNDYVMSLINIGRDANILVRNGRGINFSQIFNNSSYSRRVVRPVEYEAVIRDGFVVVSLNNTGKAEPNDWRRTNEALFRKYIIARMRQINQGDTDTPRDVFTEGNFRMVIFELLTNNIAYSTMMSAPWITRVSKLKTRLVHDCASDVSMCPFLTSRESVSNFMSSKGQALSGFDWKSGMMAFRGRLSRTQKIVGQLQTNKTGITKLLSS